MQVFSRSYRSYLEILNEHDYAWHASLRTVTDCVQPGGSVLRLMDSHDRIAADEHES